MAHQSGGAPPVPANQTRYFAPIVISGREAARLQEIVDFSDLSMVPEPDQLRLDIHGDGRHREFFRETVAFEDGCQADLAVLSGATNAWVSIQLFDKVGNLLAEESSETVLGECEFRVRGGDRLYILDVAECAGTNREGGRP
jgi:hypothetical protein